MVRPALTDETICNLCGNGRYEIVGTKSRDGRDLRTTICRDCGLVWTNPRPTLEDIDRYYRSDYRLDYTRWAVPTRRKLIRGMLGALERRCWLGPDLRPGARVLDVGCGAGEFVHVLRAAGFEASGIEPDERFGEHARQVLRLPVQGATVETASIPRGSCDMVTMFHALEHVVDPVNTLSTLTGWLCGSALVAVEVPNVEAVCQAPRHRFHHAHLFSFSPGTLEAVAARAGFARVRLELSGDCGNIRGIFRRCAGTPAPVDLVAGRARFERTLAILRAHTTVQHYLSPSPYVRPLSRWKRRITEDVLLARFPTVDAVLEWAAKASPAAQ